MPSDRSAPTIAIIGTGHSGLCVAMQLVRSGVRDFTLFEKAERIGGTWRDNTYPGAACDSPAFAYCFSFEQKTDWSRKWAEQPEILRYMERCADRYGLWPHIRTGTEITTARFDEERLCWELEAASGERFEADVLVSGVGQLSRPRIPEIPGLADFEGAAFHSARWDHAVDLEGKAVALVGSAASAVQIVPAIAEEVGHLRVFQRSPNWVAPKNDRVYPAWEQRLYDAVPGAAKLYRGWLWLQHELRFPIIKKNRLLTRLAHRITERHLAEQVADPELRAALTPTFALGAKRLLISDDYYPALTRENVTLETDGIARVEGDTVVTASGERHRADVMVFATGFDTTDFLAPMEVVGRGGQRLRDAWAEGAEAYLGVTVAGFPNLFLMYGPNTNLGHNSILFMIECQTRYILDCLAKMRERGIAAIDLKPEVQARYNASIAAELEDTVWRAVDSSWYQTEAGRITNNWPGTTVRYWWQTREADLSRYERLMPTE